MSCSLVGTWWNSRWWPSLMLCFLKTNWFMKHAPPCAIHCLSPYQLRCKHFDRRSNYAPKTNSRWNCLYLELISHGYFEHTADFNLFFTQKSQSISISSWIKVVFRNSRWQPSAMLDFLKPGFWPMCHLRLSIINHHTKFSATILIDAQIMSPKVHHI